MRTKISVFFCIILLIGSVGTYSFALANESKETNNSVVVVGQAGIVLEKEFTQEELDEFKKYISEEDLKKAYGWELEGNKLKRFYPASISDILIDDTRVTVNPNGTFRINNLSEGEIDATFKRGSYEVSKNITAKSGELVEIDLIVTGSLDDFLEKMDYTPHGYGTYDITDPGGVGQIDKHGQAGIPGWYVHCNRFNSPFGDNTYYDKSINPVKAAANFVHSDCDFAFIRYQCWEDYYGEMTNCRGLRVYGGYVNHNPHNCSEEIGETIRFHYR